MTLIACSLGVSAAATWVCNVSRNSCGIMDSYLSSHS
jgi:hypothetical protein